MTNQDVQHRTEKSEDASKSLIQTIFPNQATAALKVAFAFAGFLIVFPFVLAYLAPAVIAPYQINILICVGIALLFAATGTQATVRIGGVVLAGGAAIAIAAFMILEDHRVDQENREARKREYVRGHLSDIDKEYAVRIDVGKPVLGFPLYKDSIYEFAIFRNDIDRSFATVEFDRKKQDQKETTIFQNVNISIPKACIENMLGQSTALDWQVKHVQGSDHTDHFVIFDLIRNKEIGRFPPSPEEENERSKCNERANASDDTRDEPTRPGRRWAFLPTAWAQNAAPAALSKKLIGELQSDDLEVRRAARDEFASLPPESVRPALDILRDLGKITSNVESRYRLKLGLCIGFAQMLRLDRYKAPQIREILTDADRTALLEVAGDEDRTIHIYATEFLYDLHDRKITKMALQRAAQPADTDTEKSRRFQLLFLARSVWPTLPEPEKQELRPFLEEVRKHSSSDPKTLELLGKFS